MDKAIIERLSQESRVAFKAGDHQTAAAKFAELRTYVERSDKDARVVQLDDGTVALCTRAELDAADSPDKVTALHAHLAKSMG